MKLHLPKGLRTALLACFAAFAGVGTTISTATITGGVFAVTIAAQAHAALTVTGGATTTAEDGSINLDESASYAITGGAGTVTVTDSDVAATLTSLDLSALLSSADEDIIIGSADGGTITASLSNLGYSGWSGNTFISDITLYNTSITSQDGIAIGDMLLTVGKGSLFSIDGLWSSSNASHVQILVKDGGVLEVDNNGAWATNMRSYASLTVENGGIFRHVSGAYNIRLNVGGNISATGTDSVISVSGIVVEGGASNISVSDGAQVEIGNNGISLSSGYTHTIAVDNANLIAMNIVMNSADTTLTMTGENANLYLGSNGISGADGAAITLSGGTLGSYSGSWKSTLGMTVGDLYVYTTDYYSSAGVTISLTDVTGQDGTQLTVGGAGTLALSGSIALSSAIVMEEGSTLTIAEGATIDVSKLSSTTVDGLTSYTLLVADADSTDTSNLSVSLDDVTVTGSDVDTSKSYHWTLTDGLLSYYYVTGVTWAGGADLTWSQTGSIFDNNAEFSEGLAVVFNATSGVDSYTVTLGSDVTADTVVVNSGVTMTLDAADKTLSIASLENAGTSLTTKGTITVNKDVDNSGAMTVEDSLAAGGVVNNKGSLTVNGTLSAEEVENKEGATLSVAGAVTTTTLTNAGTVSLGAGSSISGAVVNTGVLGATGNATIGSYSNTSTGSFDVAAGATLTITDCTEYDFGTQGKTHELMWNVLTKATGEGTVALNGCLGIDNGTGDSSYDIGGNFQITGNAIFSRGGSGVAVNIGEDTSLVVLTSDNADHGIVSAVSSYTASSTGNIWLKNRCSITVDGGYLETDGQVCLGHNETGAYYGKLTITSGTAAVGGVKMINNNANCALTLTDGMLIIGADGITDRHTDTDTHVYLNGGTLGASADWTNALATSVGGAVTIDTSKQVKTDGVWAAGSEGATITIGSTLIATEDGSLALTGNGTLAVASGATLSLYGAITMGADASFSMAEGSILDLTNMTSTKVGNDTVYTILEGEGSNLDLSALTGVEITGVSDHGGTWTFGTDGTLTLAAATGVTWNGGVLTWNSGATFSDGTYADGLAVTFSGTDGEATVTLTENVAPAGVTVADAAVVSISTDSASTITTSFVENSGTLSLGAAMSTDTLANTGTLSSTAAISAASVTNSGELTVDGGLTTTGSFTNTGTFRGSFNVAGALENLSTYDDEGNIATSATIYVEADSSMGTYTLTGYGHIEEGSIRVADGATLTLNSPAGLVGTHYDEFIYFLSIFNNEEEGYGGKVVVVGDVINEGNIDSSGTRENTFKGNYEIQGNLTISSWNGMVTNLDSLASLKVTGDMSMQTKQTLNVDGNLEVVGTLKLGHEAGGTGNYGRLVIDNGGTVRAAGIHFYTGNTESGSSTETYVMLTDGRLDIGASGFTAMTTSAPGSIYLNGGTLGSTADAWSTDFAVNFGTTTIDTTKQVETDGVWGASDSGATITLGGAVTAGSTSSLTLTGSGKLVLSDSTAIELGAGLDTSAGGTLSIASALTLGGTVKLGSAIETVAGGSIALSSGTTLDLSALTAQDNVYTLLTGEGSLDLSGIDISNITITGVANADSYNWVFGTDGTLSCTLSDMLKWSGGDFTWTTETLFDGNLKAESTSAVNFVASETSSTVTMGEDITVSTVKIDEGATVALGGEHKLTATDGISLAGNLVVTSDVLTADTTLSGKGNFTISGAEVDYTSQLSGFAGAVAVTDNGTLSLSGSIGAASVTLDDGTISLSGTTLSTPVVMAGAGKIASIGESSSISAADVSGAGNLTLEGVQLSGTIAQKGDTILQGTVGIGYWQNDYSQGAAYLTNEGDVTLAEGASAQMKMYSSIANTGDINVNGELTVYAGSTLNNGGTVNVAGTLNLTKTSDGDAKFETGKLNIIGGTVNAQIAALTLTSLALDGGTLNLANAIVGGENFTLSIANEGKIVVSSADLANWSSLSGDENGLRASVYTLVSGLSGTAPTLDDTSLVYVDELSYQLTLSEDGSSIVFTQASDGVYYVSKDTVAYSDVAATEGASSIALSGGTLAVTADDTVELSMTMLKDSALDIASNTVNATSITNAGAYALALSGNGTYVVTTAGQLSGLSTTADAWTGTVTLDGSAAVIETGLDLNALGNANSTVAISGVKGYINASGGAETTYAANIVLTNVGDSAALELNNGSTGSTTTFSGTVSGEGDIIRTAAAGNEHSFKFTGDVSGWNGSFSLGESSGVTNVIFSGSSTEINAALGSASENALKVTVTNDDAVAVNSLISGNTNVTLSGAGAKTLSAANTATGTLTVGAGTATIASGAAWAGDVSVAEGSALELLGSLTGAVDNKGTLTVGETATSASLAAVTNSGSLVFNADASMGSYVSGAEGSSYSVAAGKTLTVTADGAGADVAVSSIQGLVNLISDNASTAEGGTVKFSPTNCNTGNPCGYGLKFADVLAEGETAQSNSVEINGNYEFAGNWTTFESSASQTLTHKSGTVSLEQLVVGNNVTFVLDGGTLSITGQEYSSGLGLKAQGDTPGVIELKSGTLVSDANGWNSDSALTIGAVTVVGEGAITLKGSTIFTGTVDNDGSLAFNGALSVANGDLSALTTASAGGERAEGNGFVQTKYWLVDGSTVAEGATTPTLTLGDGVTTVTVGDATYAVTAEGGSLTFLTDADNGTYYVNEGTVIYGGESSDMTTASVSSLVLNGGSLSLGSDLDAATTGGIVVKQDSTIDLASEGVTLNATSISNAEGKTVTLTGSGTYVAGTAEGVANLASLKDSAAWTGTVDTFVGSGKGAGTFVADGHDLNDLGNANSTVLLEGVTGHFASGEVNTNIVIDNTSWAGYEITGKDGEAVSHDFNGTVSGAGNLNIAASDSAVSLTFSGDVSGWTGLLDAKDGDTTTSVTFDGADQTINAQVTGNADVTFSGSGTTVLAGNGSYTGKTTISSGTVQLASGVTALGSSTSIAEGATLHLQGNQLSNAVTSAGTVVMDGSAAVSSLTGGTLQVGTGAMATVNGDLTSTALELSGYLSVAGAMGDVSSIKMLASLDTLTTDVDAIVSVNSVTLADTLTLTLDSSLVNGVKESSYTLIGSASEIDLTDKTLALDIAGATVGADGSIVVGSLNYTLGLSDDKMSLVLTGKFNGYEWDDETTDNWTNDTTSGSSLGFTGSGEVTVESTTDAPIELDSVRVDTSSSSDSYTFSSSSEESAAINTGALTVVTGEVTLDNITMNAGEVTVDDGALTVNESSSLTTDKMDVAGEGLTNEGTTTVTGALTTTTLGNTGTITADTVTVSGEAGLTNDGTTTVTGALTTTTLGNTGELSADSVTATDGLTNGGTTTVAGAIETSTLTNTGTIAADTVSATDGLTNEGTATLTGALTTTTLGNTGELSADSVSATDGLTNEGTTTVAGAIETSTLTNTGTIAAETVTIAGEGGLTNEGTATVSGALTTTTLTNKGELSVGDGTVIGTVTNDGAITATSGTTTVTELSGEGELVVNDGANLVTDNYTADVLAQATLGKGAEIALGGNDAATNPLVVKSIVADAGSSFTVARDVVLDKATKASNMTVNSLDLSNASGSSFDTLTLDALTLNVSGLLSDGINSLLTLDAAAVKTEGGTIALTLTGVDDALASALTSDNALGIGVVTEATDEVNKHTTYTLVDVTGGTTAADIWSFNDQASLQQIFAVAGTYAVLTYGADGDVVLKVFEDEPREWNSSNPNWAGNSNNNGGEVLDVTQIAGVYKVYDSVDAVVIDGNTVIDLTEDTLDNATDKTVGLVLNNLSGTGDLTLTGDAATGEAMDLVTISSSQAAALDGALTADKVAVNVTGSKLTVNTLSLSDAAMAVTGALESTGAATIAGSTVTTSAGSTISTDSLTMKDSELTLVGGAALTTGELELDDSKLTAEAGSELTAGAVTLKGDSAFVAEAGSTVSVESLNGNGGYVSGAIKVTESGSYSGRFEDATLVLGEGVQQTLTPDANLTVGGNKAEVTLNYADADATINAINVTDTKVTLNNASNGVTNTLRLSEESSMKGGELVLGVAAADIVDSVGGWGDAPAITAGEAFNLSGTKVTVNQVDDVARTTFDVSGGTDNLTLFVISDEGYTDKDVTVDFGDSKFFNRYFENVRVQNGEVKADLITDYYSSAMGETENGTTGLEMMDYAFLTLNPMGESDGDVTPYEDLAGVLSSLEDYRAAGGASAAADKLGAAVAGSGVASLSMALAGDMDRQLKAIRNRTTTMGVDPSVVNEDMPYFNAWINAEGDYRTMDDDGTLAGYTLESWGGTVGFDMDVTPSLTWGLALTAMYGDFTADATDRVEGDMDAYYISAFARAMSGAWVHTFVATVGMTTTDISRTVSYGGGSYTTEGEAEGTSFGLLYEVARTFALNEDATACWQPVFNVAYRHIEVDAYTESGSDAALALGEQSLDTVTFGLGGRLQAVVGENLYNRTSVFEARALVKLDAGDRESEMDTALLNAPAANGKVKSAELDAFGVELGAGITVPVGMESGSIFMDGSVEFRGSYTNFNGTLGYRVNF